MFDTISSTTKYTALASIALVFLMAMMFYPASVLRWLQRKRYQYEVTFSLYMLTPTEKFIFNSILFLFLAMVLIAASLYLPEHITMIARRAWYYALGDTESFTLAARGMSTTIMKPDALSSTEMVQATSSVVEEIAETITKTVQRVVESATAKGEL